ncbi:unnamed protein product [Cuscuta epithymum]|uniref:MADS-box domain-containing protein n=1 Tax=Cuscuta epithymum TaxID=186058 RepID=A0AAV0ECT1_9ASTE|nr:unnamed protein product [Cuscuta epithymum]
MESKRKKTQGRRKIDIKKIEDVNHRHVAFSKRRLGLFNKACELCILCGTHIAAIVESYGGKRVFVFGHPKPDAVIDHYLSGATAPPEWLPDDPLLRRSEQLYQQACLELEAEKEKEKEKAEEREGQSGGARWWDMPIEGMGLKELEEYTAALEELRKKAALRVDELETAAMMRENAAVLCCGSSTPPPPLSEYHHAV